jgi:hypothetical protein
MQVIVAFGSALQRQLRRAGAILCAGAAAVFAWGAMAPPAGGVVLNARLVSSGPPCAAAEACVKQSQVPTTAQGFATIDCTVSAHPDEDLWHFTFPTPGSFSTDVTQFTAIFSTPSLQIHADSIQGPGDKFAFVYSPAGATLQWAFATGASGGTEFNLSHTCPASQTTTTTTSTSTDPTTTTSTSTDPTTTTSTTTTTTTTTTVTSTGTTTDPVTGTSTSTTSVPTTGTATSTTTVTSTDTAVVSAIGTTSVPTIATNATTESGAVAPLQAANPGPSGGAGGLAPLVDTPNTGAGNRAMAALTGLLLVFAGVGCLCFSPRRTRTAQIEP